MTKKKVSDKNVKEEASVPLYKVETWKGKEHYVCPICQWDTFEKVAMLRHLVGKHNSELALVALVELEGDLPSPRPPLPEGRGEEKVGDVFEVELVETNSAVDAQGNEHKTFTIKEK